MYRRSRHIDAGGTKPEEEDPDDKDKLMQIRSRARESSESGSSESSSDSSDNADVQLNEEDNMFDSSHYFAASEDGMNPYGLA